MKIKYYEVEFVDLKDWIGKGTLNIKYKNKKEAIEQAKLEYKHLCNADKKTTGICVNRIIEDLDDPNADLIVEEVFSIWQPEIPW